MGKMGTENTNDKTAFVSDPLMDVDSIIVQIGEFGRCQIILTLSFCLLIISPSYQILAMVFVGNNPPWQCTTEGNVTRECNVTGEHSVGDMFYRERCKMNRTAWEYTKPRKFSIVTEFDLVCEKKVYAIAANSILYIGWAIGAIVLGWMSDRFGRKKVLFPSYLIVLCSAFISGFSTNLWMFAVLRIVVGFFQGGTMLVLFIICAELVGPRYRALASTFVWFMWSLGLLLLSLNAYLIPDWRLLLKVTSAPYLVFLLFWVFTPESVRWLHVNDKIGEVEKILQKVAKANKKEYPNVKLAPLPKQAEEGSFRDLFSTKQIAISTQVQCIIWCVNSMVYYGISLASDDLGGNMYRDFALTTLVEFPANVLIIVLCDKYGRKKSLTIFMFAAAAALICIGIVPGQTANQAYNWLRVGFGMLGKLFISISFGAIYILSVEIYPTIVRTQAMSLFSVSSRIGAAAAPWVAKGLQNIHPAIPFYFMGALSLITAFSCFILNETKGKPTAETYGRENKVVDVSLHEKEKTGKSSNDEESLAM